MAAFRFLAIVAILASGVCGSAGAGVLVYAQPAQSPALSVRTSQVIPPGVFNFQTFDNFLLTADTEVADVHWQGGYLNTITPTPAPSPNATAFGVSFYADSGGVPGALLATYNASPSTANETFAFNQSLFGFEIAFFNYDLDLSTPFSAAAATPYWLSVFAFQPTPSATEAQWGWAGGTGGDGTSVQSGSIVNFDRAFSLTAVPEPATISLLIMAFALVFAVRRGRKLSFTSASVR